MGRVLEEPVADVHALYASRAARLGPAPSWTSAAAVVKYVNYPRGLLQANTSESKTGGAVPTTTTTTTTTTVGPDVETEGPRVGLNNGTKNDDDDAASAPKKNGTAAAVGPYGTFRKPEDVSEGFWAPIDGRFSRFRDLRDGDLIEVEQHGGPDWVASGMPNSTHRVAGLFANVWRGTGLFLRVRAPFVSRSKGAAIADMFEELERRDARVAMDFMRKFAWYAALMPVFLDALDRHPGENPAHVFTAVLFLAEPPCLLSPSWNTTISPIWTAWRERSVGTKSGFDVGGSSSSSSATSADGRPASRGWPRAPKDIFADLALRGPTTRDSAALHWIYGICANGPYFNKSAHRGCRNADRAIRHGLEPRALDLANCRRRWMGWDSLLMVLACALGVHTLVLDTSPNDNGLFHHELIDYEVPGAWVSFPDGARTKKVHSPEKCLKPFADGRALPTVAAVLDFWAKSGKFSLADPFTKNASRPCDLLSSDLSIPTKSGLWCAQAAAKGHGCYLACIGTMSQAHAKIGIDVRLGLDWKMDVPKLKALWGPLPANHSTRRRVPPPRNSTPPPRGRAASKRTKNKHRKNDQNHHHHRTSRLPRHEPNHQQPKQPPAQARGSPTQGQGALS